MQFPLIPTQIPLNSPQKDPFFTPILTEIRRWRGFTFLIFRFFQKMTFKSKKPSFCLYSRPNRYFCHFFMEIPKPPLYKNPNRCIYRVFLVELLYIFVWPKMTYFWFFSFFFLFFFKNRHFLTFFAHFWPLFYRKFQNLWKISRAFLPKTDRFCKKWRFFNDFFRVFKKVLKNVKKQRFLRFFISLAQPGFREKLPYGPLRILQKNTVFLPKNVEAACFSKKQNCF